MFGLTPYRRGNEITDRNDPWDIKGFFNDFFSDSLIPTFATVNPIKADIKETEKEFVIEAEMPGAKKEDIKLNLRDDTLTIAIEHNEQVNEEKENYIRKERRYGSYSRSFYLNNVNEDGINAKYVGYTTT
jgi:HSP20 family protein